MWVPNEGGNGGYDDGQPDPNATDPSQKYAWRYEPTENGQGYMNQIINPNYDWEKYDPEEWAASQEYARQHMNDRGGGLGSIISSSPLARITDALSKPVGQAADYFRDKIAPLSPYLAAAAITGGTAAEFLPGFLASGASAGVPSVAGGAAEAAAAPEVGSFLTGASSPGFATTGTLAGEAGFGGATYGAAAPATLTGMTGAALPAAATSGATSGIAKLAEAMGINKAAEMLGMDPTELMKIAGGVIAGGATALANRGSGSSAPLTRTGFQGQIDPKKIKYIGNNQYAPNPVVKAAAGGGIRGLGMRGMAPNQYKAGGKYLSGPGDGMSDNIKANIDGHQEARLADGEFVLPADIVSHIGNGSSNAGAKKLHKMMDRIRRARTGNPKQGKQIKAEKFLPA
jgi:hypothetical protein